MQMPAGNTYRASRVWNGDCLEPASLRAHLMVVGVGLVVLARGAVRRPGAHRQRADGLRQQGQGCQGGAKVTHEARQHARDGGYVQQRGRLALACASARHMCWCTELWGMPGASCKTGAKNLQGSRPSNWKHCCKLWLTEGR